MSTAEYSARMDTRMKKYFPGKKITKVIDAEKRINILVSKEDCQEAVPGDPHACAMAIATKRQTKYEDAVILRTNSYVRKGTIVTRYKTPGTVAREITSFDRSAGFYDGSYHLAPVSPAMRQGVPQKKKPTGPHTTKSVPRPVHRTGGIRASD